MCAASGKAEDRKIVLLFDEINKQEDFDEDQILEKVPALKATQLSNLKAYLYEKILQSIRQYNAAKIPDIQIREQIDYAQLLFERRLYAHGKNCLKKAKKMANLQNNLEIQLEIIKLEKVSLAASGEDNEMVDMVIAEAREINSQINNINTFSNLSVKLDSLYRKTGYIRDEDDYKRVREFFDANMLNYDDAKLSISERTHLYRLYIGYYFFSQDFDNGYLYAKKLEDVFESNLFMIRSHTEVYITSLNNMLTAQYKLFRYEEFLETNKKLQSVKQMNLLHISESIRVRLLKYYYTHEINKFFMQGNFNEGVDFIIKEHGETIDELIDMLDQHSSMIFSYKIACLYFGAGNFGQSIRWLNKIINITNMDIREDLHCFARILNLVCHFELRNFDVIHYYIISTYRFLLKKDDLHMFQKYILSFIKNLSKQKSDKDLLEQFNTLNRQLLPLVNNPYEKRAFIYFDIISWLESKIENKTVQQVVKYKFDHRDHPSTPIKDLPSTPDLRQKPSLLN